VTTDTLQPAARLDLDRHSWTAAGATHTLDIVTTAVGIQALGGTEANPTAAAVMARVGVLPAMVLLTAAVFAAAAVLWHTARRYELPAKWAIPGALAAVGAVVVARNLALIAGEM